MEASIFRDNLKSCKASSLQIGWIAWNALVAAEGESSRLVVVPRETERDPGLLEDHSRRLLPSRTLRAECVCYW